MSASQAELWSGPVGESWVRNAAAYDRILEPLGRAALERLAPGPRERVLDVGCGTGSTTLEIGQLVRPGGRVLGVDVSRPMIAYAQTRLREAVIADTVEFAALDVETDEVPGPFDAAFSRLGMMFFDRPQVALAALASSLTAGGRLVFICFSSPAQNPFITVPTGAALATMRGAGMPPAGAAGPFSLADPDQVRGLLEFAGFEGVAVSGGPDEVTLGPADRIEELATQALEQNPLVMSVLAADPGAREAAVTAAAAALREHVRDGEVRLGAGTWIVEARAAD